MQSVTKNEKIKEEFSSNGEFEGNSHWLNIPNILTINRILAIPFMASFILKEEKQQTAFILFLAIWLTDVLDGFLARRLNQITDLGKVLDPLADKLFQATSGFLLWWTGRLPLWVPVLLLVNQLIMVAGGIFFWTEGTTVKSDWWGKLTTVLLTICFGVLFILPERYYTVVHYIFILPVALSFYSTVRYGIQYYRHYKRLK